ncbi:MAG: IclR family transcriptional regulator [Candidatus Aminicenantes bacterium]|nr:IclR family transcriptional regulator [Candidatus Aminicenantes bacterium]
MEKEFYYTIGSLAKAFRVIELLVAQKEYELRELCKGTGLQKTTVHRILLTLQDLGYVKQNPENRKYQATIKYFELGQSVIHHTGLIDVARPHMLELSRNAGESVNLGTLDGIDALCIDRVEGKNPLKVDQPVGSRYPAYVSAFGKAMLAFLPDEERDSLLRAHKLIRLTNRTLRSRAALEEDLKESRERGFATDDEEAVLGIRCVGAPIFSYSDRIVAGISVAAPASRIDDRKIRQLSRLVMRTASLISMDLGMRREST